MTLALLFTLLSGLCWAGLDALRKRLANDLGVISLIVLLSFGQLPAYAIWSVSAGAGVPDVGYLVPGLIGVALNVAANLLFVRAVQISPLSVTIPFLSFTPVFTAAIAGPLLGEVPTLQQAGGIGLIVIGALVLAAGRSDGSQGRGPAALWRAVREERGAIMMLGVAALWASTAALDKFSMQFADLPIHAAVQNGGVGVALLVVLLAQGRLRELGRLRQVPWLTIGAMAVNSGAFGFQLLAIRDFDVGPFEAIKRALGLASAIALGRMWFAEPITPTKIGAAVCMALGTAALVL